MRKTVISAIAVLIMLASTLFSGGCSLLEKKNEEQSITEPVVSPSIDVSNRYYAGILPYQPNKARGTLGYIRERLDATHLELGLMEIAQNTFDTDKYLFREGQIITENNVNDWLKESEQLIHVLEHDYLRKENGEFVGTVIALSFTPLKTVGDKTEMMEDEALRKLGMEWSGKVVSKVRESNPTTPMIIALYAVEHGSSFVPGRFLAVGKVDSDESAVSEWEAINEQYYLLPGDKAYQADKRVSLNFEEFSDQVRAFFPHYVGVVGVARYVNNQMVELTITATAEYDSKTETIQFTQFAADQFAKYFSEDVHINLYVQTVNRQLAVYVRPAMGEGETEAFFHVFRNN